MLTTQIHGKCQSFGGVFFDSSAKLLNFKKRLVGQLQLQATNKAFKRTNNSWLRSYLADFSQLSFAA